MPLNFLLLSPQVAKTFSERISQYAQVVVESLAFAGTGDVLRVQQLLAVAGEHIEVEDDTTWKVHTQFRQDFLIPNHDLKAPPGAPPCCRTR